jgi:hypothetical protein
MIQQFHYLELLFLSKGKEISLSKRHIPVFIVTLFTIDKKWKLLKSLPTDEWIKKIWYIYKGILISHKEMK